THRWYDALQYPIIFWDGADEYHFNIKMTNPMAKKQIRNAAVRLICHKYGQDAIAYVRQYGCPDLFITFTCNPAWDDIQNLLHPGQLTMERHDITARVFRQKLKSLMVFMVKHEVFGSVRCWMYSVEWQKSGLPHAHILIWLYDKITSNETDDVICAEIPDPDIDKNLYEIVTKNMIHGPCGTLNPTSPCMIDGKCSKQPPRALISNTITGNDG
ncbi:unnamed protein product, partial [Onchocerca ochengi]